MPPSSTTAIPQIEIDALASKINEARPWNIAAYQIMLFARRFFFTTLCIFIAFAVTDEPSLRLAIIGAALLFDIFITKKAYDICIDNAELVRLMYATDKYKQKHRSEWKKYRKALLPILFFALALALATKLGLLPATTFKYILAATVILTTLTSSFLYVRAYASIIMFSDPEMYIKQEMEYQIGIFPIKVFKPFTSRNTQRILESIFYSALPLLYATLAIYIALISFENFKPDWEIFIAIYIVLMPIGIGHTLFYPMRHFRYKCTLIEEYRLSIQLRGKS